MIESIFSSTTAATISVENFLICIGVGIILGAIISATHKLTTKTTPNFVITLTILPVLVLVVIILVNGNLGTSLAVAGTFGLIKFRSMQGNSKEIVSVFWAMAVGLALGMGFVTLAILITIIVSIMMFVLSRFTNIAAGERKLKIVIPENLDYEEVFDDVLKAFTSKCEMMKVKTTNMGSMYELQYRVVLNKGVKEKDFLDEIRVRNGNMLVMLERQEISEVEL